MDAAGAVAELRARWGIHAPAVERLLRELSGEPRRIAELVEATGISRRGVQETLQALDAFVRHDDRAVALTREAADAMRPALLRPARDEDALAAAIADWQARLPAPDRDLDHVGATEQTVLKRA